MEAITKLSNLSGSGYSRLTYVDGKKAYHLAREDMGDKNSPLLPITEEVIKAHLDGSQPVAINLHVGDKKSHIGVLDFDDHDGSRPPQFMIDRVGYVAAALTKIGVAHFVVRSGGGNGYHIWVAWENAKRFDSIRETLNGYLDAANKLLANSPWPSEKFVPDDGKGKGMFFADGDGGKRHFVEIIPKGGNFPMIALSLAGKSVVMTPIGIDEQCGFMKFEEGGDLKVEFAKLKRGPKGEQAQTSQEVELDNALQCYIKAFPGDDYSNWVRAAFHICGAFGDQGLELFQQYSKQNDGFKSESDVSKKWNEIAPSCEPNGYAFWAYARQGGYKGGLPDGIEFTKSGGQQHILNDIVDSFEVFQDLDGIAFARINQRRVLPVESGKGRCGGDAVFLKFSRLVLADIGNKAQMIVVAALGFAAFAPSADIAVFFWFGVMREGRIIQCRLLNGGFCLPKVSGIVRVAELLRLKVRPWCDDIDKLWRLALCMMEKVSVKA